MNPVSVLSCAQRLGPERAASRGIRPEVRLTRWGQPYDGSMVAEELPSPDIDRWHRARANPGHPHTPKGCLEVWISREWIVQLYEHPNEPWRRLSFRRIDGEEIRCSWSTLQRMKSDIVGRDVLAVECYPSHRDVVDLAPMRHLFIVPDGYMLPCLWREEVHPDSGVKP